MLRADAAAFWLSSWPVERGERFWPQSRPPVAPSNPPIVATSMLAQTVERLPGLVEQANIIVITNREQRAAVLETCLMLPPANIVAEPVGRDTAAAVAGCAFVGRRDPKATLAMLPADHVIHDTAAFREVLAAAFEAAEAETRLVTLTLIRPSRDRHGYIQSNT